MSATVLTLCLVAALALLAAWVVVTLFAVVFLRDLLLELIGGPWRP